MSDQSMSERYDHVVAALFAEEQRAKELREHRRFEAAKAAMQGHLSAPWHPDMGVDWRTTPKDVARWSVEQADALLAALDAGKEAPDARE